MQSETSILQLNNHCLTCICKYLDCKDHASFVRVCQHFRQSFQEFPPEACLEMRIEQPNVQYKLVLFFNLSNTVTHLYIDLDELPACLHHSDKWYQKLWRPPSLVDQIFQALQSSSSLKSLQLHSKDFCKTWSFKHIDKLTQLEKLYVGMGDMSAKNWLQCYKNNANLRVLQCVCTDNSAVWRHLSEHCKNLQELRLHLHVSSADIRHIVQLPKLNTLRINGFRHSRELTQLLRLFATTDGTQLKALHIALNFVDLGTAMQIGKIKSLRDLSYEIIDANCLKPLTALTALETLSIYMWPTRMSPNLDAVLPVLESCTKLKLLSIKAFMMETDFITKAMEVLKRVRSDGERRPLKIKLYANICQRAVRPNIPVEAEKYMRVKYYDEMEFMV